MAQPPQIPETWQDLRARLERDAGAGAPPGGIYVLGGPDAGKSTLCRYLVDSLARSAPTTLLDVDPGQSSLGPPTTLGLAVAREASAREADAEGAGALSPAALRFVGSTTPVGHLLQMLVGAKRLAERAAMEETRWLVIDSPGMVAGETAREFQHQMIDVLAPDWLVVLDDRSADDEASEDGEASDDGTDIESIVSVFAVRDWPTVCRIPVAEAVAPRSAAQRAAYRRQRFTAYFGEAATHELDLKGRGLHGHLPRRSAPADAVGRLVALCDRAGWVVVLGVVESVDWSAGRLRLYAPAFDHAAIVSVAFGSHRMP